MVVKLPKKNWKRSARFCRYFFSVLKSWAENGKFVFYSKMKLCTHKIDKVAEHVLYSLFKQSFYRLLFLLFYLIMHDNCKVPTKKLSKLLLSAPAFFLKNRGRLYVIIAILNAFCQSLFYSQQNRTNVFFPFLEAYIVPMIPFWLPL